MITQTSHVDCFEQLTSFIIPDANRGQPTQINHRQTGPCWLIAMRGNVILGCNGGQPTQINTARLGIAGKKAPILLPANNTSLCENITRSVICSSAASAANKVDLLGNLERPIIHSYIQPSPLHYRLLIICRILASTFGPGPKSATPLQQCEETAIRRAESLIEAWRVP